MDASDPTGLLYSKIKSLDPDNARKIIGYVMFLGFGERDLIRLALGPDTLLHSLVLKAKTDLGLLPNAISAPSAPCSPSNLSPIARPVNGGISNQFSRVSPRASTNGYVEFTGNSTASPWLVNRNPNGGNYISLKSSPFSSADSVRAGLPSKFLISHESNDDCSGDATVETGANADLFFEQQLGDCLSFLDESTTKGDECVDPRVQFGSSLDNGDTNLHRRSFSASDACFGSEDAGFGAAYKPCVYFSRGFCKNGDSCKFVHSGFPDNMDFNGDIVGYPSEIRGLYQRREELMRMKAAQQQRMAAAQFMARVPSETGVNFPLHPRSPRAGALMIGGEDRFWCSSPGRLEMKDPLGMGLNDKSNSAARQIYLTFPADSSFKDEDVANYFRMFGPVQDVRIPYQQKRMFGFVTFLLPETVKIILARGNPHFICDSRVLVKPYKEKGKVLDKRQQNLQQQFMERGHVSLCSCHSAVDPPSPHDFHSGRRMFYETQEMSLRRQLAAQANLHKVMEAQRRNCMNLQLRGLSNEVAHHHNRSLSVDSPADFSSCINENLFLPSENVNQESVKANDSIQIGNTSPTTAVAEKHPQPDASAACVLSNDECQNADLNSKNLAVHALSDTLCASTKSIDALPSESTELNTTNEKSVAKEDDPAVPTTSNDAPL